MQLKLVHVAIPAPDVEASARFYSLLGAERGFCRRDEVGRPLLLQMRFSDTFVELLADAGPTGGGHLALSTKDIEGTWRLLADHGHTPLAKPASGVSGVAWFFVRDPGGNSVEITAPLNGAL